MTVTVDLLLDNAGPLTRPLKALSKFTKQAPDVLLSADQSHLSLWMVDPANVMGGLVTLPRSDFENATIRTEQMGDLRAVALDSTTVDTITDANITDSLHVECDGDQWTITIDGEATTTDYVGLDNVRRPGTTVDEVRDDLDLPVEATVAGSALKQTIKLAKDTSAHTLLGADDGTLYFHAEGDVSDAHAVPPQQSTGTATVVSLVSNNYLSSLAQGLPAPKSTDVTIEIGDEFPVYFDYPIYGSDGGRVLIGIAPRIRKDGTAIDKQSADWNPTPDPTLTIEADADTLVHTTAPLQTQVDEARLHFRPDALETAFVDPANVAMSHVEADPAAFDSYDLDTDHLRVGANTTHLHEIADDLPDGPATFAVDMDTRRYSLQSDWLTYRNGLIDPDAIRREPESPGHFDLFAELSTTFEEWFSDIPDDVDELAVGAAAGTGYLYWETAQEKPDDPPEAGDWEHQVVIRDDSTDYKEQFTIGHIVTFDARGAAFSRIDARILGDFDGYNWYDRPDSDLSVWVGVDVPVLLEYTDLDGILRVADLQSPRINDDGYKLGELERETLEAAGIDVRTIDNVLDGYGTDPIADSGLFPRTPADDPEDDEADTDPADTADDSDESDDVAANGLGNYADEGWTADEVEAMTDLDGTAAQFVADNTRSPGDILKFDQNLDDWEELPGVGEKRAKILRGLAARFEDSMFFPGWEWDGIPERYQDDSDESDEDADDVELMDRVGAFDRDNVTHPNRHRWSRRSGPHVVVTAEKDPDTKDWSVTASLDDGTEQAVATGLTEQAAVERAVEWMTDYDPDESDEDADDEAYPHYPHATPQGTWEAHDRAKAYHEQRKADAHQRDITFLQNHGISKKRTDILLDHYDSARAARRASPARLEDIEGIGPATVEKLRDIPKDEFPTRSVHEWDPVDHDKQGVYEWQSPDGDTRLYTIPVGEKELDWRDDPVPKVRVKLDAPRPVGEVWLTQPEGLTLSKGRGLKPATTFMRMFPTGWDPELDWIPAPVFEAGGYDIDNREDLPAEAIPSGRDADDAEPPEDEQEAERKIPWEETLADDGRYYVEWDVPPNTHTKGYELIVDEQADGWQLRLINKGSANKRGGGGVTQRLTGLSKADAMDAAWAAFFGTGEWADWQETAREQDKERRKDRLEDHKQDPDLLKRHHPGLYAKANRGEWPDLDTTIEGGITVGDPPEWATDDEDEEPATSTSEQPALAPEDVIDDVADELGIQRHRTETLVNEAVPEPYRGHPKAALRRLSDAAQREDADLFDKIQPQSLTALDGIGPRTVETLAAWDSETDTPSVESDADSGASAPSESGGESEADDADEAEDSETPPRGPDGQFISADEATADADSSDESPADQPEPSEERETTTSTMSYPTKPGRGGEPRPYDPETGYYVSEPTTTDTGNDIPGIAYKQGPHGSMRPYNPSTGEYVSTDAATATTGGFPTKPGRGGEPRPYDPETGYYVSEPTTTDAGNDIPGIAYKEGPHGDMRPYNPETGEYLSDSVAAANGGTAANGGRPAHWHGEYAINSRGQPYDPQTGKTLPNADWVYEGDRVGEGGGEESPYDPVTDHKTDGKVWDDMLGRSFVFGEAAESIGVTVDNNERQQARASTPEEAAFMRDEFGVDIDPDDVDPSGSPPGPSSREFGHPDEPEDFDPIESGEVVEQTTLPGVSVGEAEMLREEFGTDVPGWSGSGSPEGPSSREFGHPDEPADFDPLESGEVVERERKSGSGAGLPGVPTFDDDEDMDDFLAF